MWSNTPILSHVTTWIEGLIFSQLILVNKYDLVQESENTWFVKHDNNGQRTCSNSLIPKYQQVRKVTKS